MTSLADPVDEGVRPFAVITPSVPAISLRDLWGYRDLLYFLVLRDLSLRYRQTALGIMWALLQPVLAMIILTLLLGRVQGLRPEHLPYAVFAYIGLVPWTYVANAVTSSSNSLVGSSNLVTKVYFPRVVIPGAAVLAGLVDMAVALPLGGALLLYYGLPIGWTLALLPPFIALTALFALAVGLAFSALNVKYRDVRHVIPFLLQMAFFLTPVIYPPSLVPSRWRWALALNPMAGILDGYRAAFLGTPVETLPIMISIVVTLLLLYASARLFRSMEASFADII
jgi:lipopolysaccharide transport system permease protein